MPTLPHKVLQIIIDPNTTISSVCLCRPIIFMCVEFEFDIRFSCYWYADIGIYGAFVNWDNRLNNEGQQSFTDR